MTIASRSAGDQSHGVALEESGHGVTPDDLHDIQGNVVRGYRMPNARHFALRVADSGGARRFVGGLIPGSDGESPRVTTAAPWGSEKPRYCLNIGFTWNGLSALGLPMSTLSLFPKAFQSGPQGNAAAIGDEGPSASATWAMGGPANPQVHAVLSLFTNEARHPCMDAWTAVLERLFAANRIEADWRIDAAAFPDGRVHFGYKDGIAQPRIKGVSRTQLADMQPVCEPGEFLLGGGYINQYGGNFIGALPPPLADNATYGAFRVLEQDVAGFEQFLVTAGRRYNMDPEFVAAKLMGRWRNGVPLTLSPETPERHIEPSHINDFDFAPSDGHPTYYDDKLGLRCPVGAHIRRLNPRGALVMGMPHSRRIIRRGMPYGPLYDPAVEDETPQARGLVGYFICGDLGMQFEFLQSTWVNADFSTSGIRGTREPVLGAQPDCGGQFVLRTNDSRDPIVFDNLPRFVRTRGSVYCVIPAIGGLRFLAGIQTEGS
jgi:deferrochelatase/peroxidase EfeB